MSGTYIYRKKIMLKRFIVFFTVLMFAGICNSSAQDVAPVPGGFKYQNGDTNIEVKFLSPEIVRVSRYSAAERPDRYSPAVVLEQSPVKVKFTKKAGITVSTDVLSVSYDPAADQFSFAAGKKKLLCEKPMTATPKSQTFILEDGEAVYGLGQHQQGGLNQRGREVYLRQENMEIAVPLIHSVKGYALFWDNASATRYIDNEDGMTFKSEAGDFSEYYFIYGQNGDGVIAGIRKLTGNVPMFPLWSYGFIQSRERYETQDQLVGIVKKYRELNVPLDGIVQDWRYWGDDHHWWNAVEFLSPGFKDPERMMTDVKALNANALISIWPSFGPNTNIHKELAKENLLMKHETFPQDHGVKVYDPWNPRAREIYWKYIKNNIYDLGIAGYWLDATEPEHNPIKPGDFDYMTPEGTFGAVRNTFPIVSVGGVYDSQRSVTDDKRVLILTRSAYLGQQRYATHVWSGDVFADWQVLHNQIPAALNFSLGGIPYWNSDIGGFWTWREFPEGVKDPKFHKLYNRWMQFAVFTGMMRSHGSNTPREIFKFGKKGDKSFDIQEKFINLRYRLLPYIYSTAWEITSDNGTLMRALFMDYPADRNVWNIDDQYMFGRSFLVAPVVTPKDSREVYLPEGEWVDFWTGAVNKGGCTVVRETPEDEIPVYVKAGTILPVGPSVQYASEKEWDDIQIRVYPGKNAEFTLYEDAKDGYDYENGEYSLIRMTWDDSSRVLTVHKREGSFPQMIGKRVFRVVVVDGESGLGLDNETYDVKVGYEGRKVKVAL